MANSTINQLEYHGTLYDVEDTAARTGLETKANADDVNAALSGKVDKVSGKGLSTNDYTTAEKTKLAGIAEGAEVNVQSDWNQTTTTADDYIKNKPTLGTAAAANTSDFATAAQGTKADNAIPSSEKGAANGVAELDSNGLVPSSQLPSYVDDVLEYSSQSAFPVTGQTGKIYIAQDTNKTYRWSGSAYVEISASLALGTTDSTAYRGDRGQTAYNHATDSSRLTTAKASGLYKIATTAEGHVASATDVTKTDITNLGIPAQDTTYESKSAVSGGTAVSLCTTGEKYNWNNKPSLTNSTTPKVDGTAAIGTSTYAAKADHVHPTDTSRQAAITAQNPLSADVVNDANTTHKFVSASEKTTWNSKQDALSQAQMAAVNSGATQAKIDQIETNKNEIVNLKVKTAKVYGFHVNPNESDSSAAVTYLADAVGMTPAKMGTTFDYGSWANVFFMPKPCMVKPDGTVDYYLNPNNYAEKLDGTPSELATAPTDNLLSNISYTNNAMMEWDKIWFKYEAGQADGEWSFYVSNQNVDGTFKCWCNINANNNEIDHFYTAIYNGVGCNSKMRSVSGVKLSTENESDNTTVAQEVAAATANNSTANPEWYTEVWSDRLLINALLYLMGKSLDLQGTYGQGITSGDQAAKQNYITGSLDDKGLFYGDTSGTSTAVKVFGMENLWACVWRRVAGCILNNGNLKVKMTYDTADGSSAHGYNTTGNGYLDFGSVPTSNNYVYKMTADSNKGYKPSAVQNNSSYYYKDAFSQSQSVLAYLLLGGSSNSGAYCGFYIRLDSNSSVTGWHISDALSLKRWTD